MRVFFVSTAAVAFSLVTSLAAQKAVSDPLERLAGPWRIDKSTAIAKPPPADSQRKPQGQPPGGQGGGGGRGGLPGMGGRGGFPGMGGGGGQPSEADLHRMDVLRRRLSETPEKMMITREGDLVSFADSDGRTFSVKVDGKKYDRVSGDGEFKTRARFEGSTLVIEDDFGDGAKAIASYTSMLYGDERLLEIEVKVEGLPSGPPRMPGGQGGSRGAASNSSKRTYEFDAPK